MHEVFVNYRTKDGAYQTIVHELSRRFGGELVFHASTSIRPGDHWPAELLNHVRSCSVLLAVIDASWTADPRLQEESYWVRREIVTALQSGVRVIPVLTTRQVARLQPEDLPDDLAELAEIQSIPLDLPHSMDLSLTRLGDELVELLPELKAADRDAAPESSGEDSGGTHNTVSGDVGENSLQLRDIGSSAHVTIQGGGGSITHTGGGSSYDQRSSGQGAAYNTGGHNTVNHRHGERDREGDQ